MKSLQYKKGNKALTNINVGHDSIDYFFISIPDILDLHQELWDHGFMLNLIQSNRELLWKLHPVLPFSTCTASLH